MWRPLFGFVFGFISGFSLLTSCGGGTGPEGIARRFVENYYVETNLIEASQDCDGLALEKVKNSQALTQGQIIDDRTRRPKVFHDLLESATGSEEATYLFRVTIQPPDFQEIVKKTSIKLRRRESGWKVTQFSDYE